MFTPLISALRGQRQADLSEFEASIGYIVSSRTVKEIQRNHVLKNKQTKKKARQ